MKSSAKKIELASVDDLFSTEEGRQDAKLEKIQEIPEKKWAKPAISQRTSIYLQTNCGYQKDISI